MKVHLTVANSLCYLQQIVLIWLIWQNVISAGQLLPYKRSFDSDCSGLLQDCQATAEILYWRLQQQKQQKGKKQKKQTKTNKQKTTISPRVCGIHLNSLCLKEEEIKSHFLNAGHRASGLEACSFILPIMQVKLFSNGIMSFTMEIPFIVH